MSKHTIDEILRLGKSPLQRDRTAYEKAVQSLYRRADTSGFGWNPAGGEADDVDLHDMVDGVRDLPRVPGVGRVAVVTMPAYIHEGNVARRATQRRLYVGHKGHHWRWYSILEDAPVLAVRPNPRSAPWHKQSLEPSLPATTENIDAAREWMLSMWRKRAENLGRAVPKDLRGSCKFSSIFAQKVFGGKMEGNKLHQFNRLPDGSLLDLNEFASDVAEMNSPHVHDPRFWGNREHVESMSSCRPAAEEWAKNFLKRMKTARLNPGASNGSPTALNMSVLVQTFGLANSVPNKIDPADLPHLSRCMKAGLLVPEGRARLVLTDAGVKARDAYIAANPGALRAANDSRPNPGPKRRTPAILRHCVAKVAPKRGVSGAYAICTASLQRAGVMRGGKLTAAGKQRDAARRKRTPENKAKDANFERVLRKTRSGR